MRKKKALEKLNQVEKDFQQTEFKFNTLSVQYEKMLNDYKVCYSALEASQKRIKELNEINEQLSAEVEALRANNAKLCQDIEERRSREAVIEPPVAPVLEQEESAEVAEPAAEETAAVEPPASPVVCETSAPKKEVKISEIEKFGSAVIGNVVVEATRIIGTLAGKTSPNAKDTLTLVLGRTEVLKSEVLAVICDESLDDEAKKQKITACRDQAMEYLASVEAQN